MAPPEAAHQHAGTETTRIDLRVSMRECANVLERRATRDRRHRYRCKRSHGERKQKHQGSGDDPKRYPSWRSISERMRDGSWHVGVSSEAVMIFVEDDAQRPVRRRSRAIREL